MRLALGAQGHGQVNTIELWQEVASLLLMGEQTRGERRARRLHWKSQGDQPSHPKQRIHNYTYNQSRCMYINNGMRWSRRFPQRSHTLPLYSRTPTKSRLGLGVKHGAAQRGAAARHASCLRRGIMGPASPRQGRAVRSPSLPIARAPIPAPSPRTPLPLVKTRKPAYDSRCAFRGSAPGFLTINISSLLGMSPKIDTFALIALLAAAAIMRSRRFRGRTSYF